MSSCKSWIYDRLGCSAVQPYILQHARMSELLHSLTFFNCLEHFTISGNIIYDLTDHLPNFLIINKFSLLPTNIELDFDERLFLIYWVMLNTWNLNMLTGKLFSTIIPVNPHYLISFWQNFQELQTCIFQLESYTKENRQYNQSLAVRKSI